MTLYTIRPDFTIWKDGIIYAGGDEIDLSPSEVKMHRHKLEGLASNVTPLNLPSAIGSYDDAIPQLGANSYQSAIAVVDSRLDVIEATILPVAPDTNILLDGLNGSDLNNGFVAPIKTQAKLQAILDSYDWQKQDVTVFASNLTALTLSSVQKPNFNSLSLDFNNQIVTNNLVFDYFDIVNLYNVTCQGSARVGFNFCREVSVSCDFNGPTGIGGIVSAYLCDTVNFNINSATNINSASLSLFTGQEINYFNAGTSVANLTLTRLSSLLDLRKTKILVFPGSPTINLATGRIIDASLSPFINILKTGTFSASLNDLYPSVYVLNDRTIIAPTYTTRLSGLQCAVNTDTTKWQITTGQGQIVDGATNPFNPVFRTVTVTAAISVQNKPTQLNGVVTSVYAYYFWNGSAIAIGYQTSAPVGDDLIDKLFLCSIISLNGTTISEVRPLNLPNEPETKALLDRGSGINVDNVFPTGIANTARLNIASQKVKFAGRWHHVTPKTPHTTTLAAVNPIQYYLVNPTTGEPINLTLETDFNFNRVWNGSAVTSLSDSNYFSVQFLFRYPNGVFLVVPGQYEYVSLVLAATLWQGLETKRHPSAFKNNTLYLGAIAGRGNLTNITDNNPTTGQALFIPHYG